MLLYIFHQDNDKANKIDAFTRAAIDTLGIEINELILNFTEIPVNGNVHRSGDIIYGVVDYHDDCTEVKINPNMHSGVQGLTICHELIHVKQFIEGRLKVVQGGIEWEGEYYPTSVPYEERPWEIEAESMERKVFDSALAII